jgi:hypothetical protein
MKIGLWICVLAGVGVAHLALLFIVDHWRNSGPYVPPPEPNFRTATYHYVNEGGAEVKLVKEFTVSTQFADTPAPKQEQPKPAEKK